MLRGLTNVFHKKQIYLFTFADIQSHWGTGMALKKIF
jgi:hypothetical protein